MTDSFDTQWKRQLQRMCGNRLAGKVMGRISAHDSIVSDSSTPPLSPSVDSTLQELIDEKSKAAAEESRLNQSPVILLAHKDIPLARVKQLEGTIDRLIQIQSQHPSPNSTMEPGSPSGWKQEDFSQTSEERTVECVSKSCMKERKQGLRTKGGESESDFRLLLDRNRDLESQLSESQRKVQELVCRNNDLLDSQELIKQELKLTIKTLIHCRDFKLSCGKYVKELETELKRLRKEMHIKRGLQLEEILRNFALRIESLEESVVASEEGTQVVEKYGEEASIEELEASNEVLLMDNERLQLELKNAKSAFETQSMEQTEFHQSRKLLEDESKRLMEQVKSLQGTIEAQAADLRVSDNLKSELQRLMTENQKIVARNQELELEIEKNDQEEGQDESKICDQNAQVAYLLLRKENEELTSQVKRLQTLLSSLHAQNEHLATDLQESKRRNELLEKSNSDSGTKLGELEKLRSHLKKEEGLRKRLESEVREMKTEAVNNASKLSTDVEALTANLKSCKLQLKRSTDKLQHVQTQREQLQDSLAASTTRTTQLQEQVSTQLELLKDKDKTYASLERRIGEFEATVNNLETELQARNDLLQEANQREKDLKKEIEMQWIQLSKCYKSEGVLEDTAKIQELADPEESEDLEFRVYFESWLGSIPSKVSK